MIPRIALVTHTLMGGVWSVVLFLAEVIRQNGRYQAEIISVATSAQDPANSGLLRPWTLWRGPQVVDLRQDENPHIHVGAAGGELEFQRYQPRRALTRLLNQYDLIQIVAGTPAWAWVAQGVSPPVCLFAATMVQQERKTQTRHIRGWKKYWRKAMTRRVARIEQRALSSVSWVFAESVYTHKLYSPFVDPERLCLGPPGVDADFFSANARYRPDGYILSVGRLSDPRKNIRMLLEAYHQLRINLPAAPPLVLVGPTDLSSEGWAYATSSGIAGFLKTYTGVAKEELRSLYQNASLFVLSSNEEGLGIVILEAMASGLPVVSTDCGGPLTAVVDGKTGFLTPVGDAKKLQAAMGTLLKDPETAEQMGKAGRKRVEELFSLEKAGKVYLEKYGELIGR